MCTEKPNNSACPVVNLPNTANPKPKTNTMNQEQPENPVQVNLERAIAIPENDVKSDSFESKLDPFFSSKSKESDVWTRRSSIKLFGQWT